MSTSTLPSHEEKAFRPEPASSIIELIYAGHALARYLGINSGGSLTECLCGTITPDPEIPANHHKFCPVAHYYATVDAVRKAALLG